MNNHETNTPANLDFFIYGVLHPALKLGDESANGSFGLLEAAHWGRLGAIIGYFEPEEILGLLSGTAAIFTAWSNLLEHEILAPDDVFSHIIFRDQSGHPVLNASLFSEKLEMHVAAREFLQSAFQTCLLLNSENILEDASRYFLNAIGWADDEDWDALKAGRSSGSVEMIGVGFANVLTYWNEINSVQDWMLHEHALRRHFQIDLYGISFAVQQDAMPVVRKFLSQLKLVVSRRFNLRRRTVERYFALAGEFVGRAREDTPAWIDARRGIFDRLISAMLRAGVPIELPKHAAELWDTFLEAGRASLARDVTRQSEFPNKLT